MRIDGGNVNSHDSHPSLSVQDPQTFSKTLSEEVPMRTFALTTLAVCAAAVVGTGAQAQQPAPQPPEYGMPITQAQAMKVAAAAQEQATKLNIHAVITIVGPSGDLIYFTKMDRAQYGSVEISQQKARTAALFRRPSKVFEEALAGGGAAVTMLTLRGIAASAGGIPLMVGGKVIGAIGVSGGPRGAIDAEAAQAGADALK
jgi:uncharacterized protein GlcG (DUF336 family)